MIQESEISEFVNDGFEKLLLIGEDSSVNSLKLDLIQGVAHHLALDMQHLKMATIIRGLKLLIKIMSEAPERLVPVQDNLYLAICGAINSGDKLCSYGLALVQSLLSSSTGLSIIESKKKDLLHKLIQSVNLPSVADCHIKAIECIWHIRKSSPPLVPKEILEVTDMLFTYMVTESGENKFKLLVFLMDIIHAAKNIVTGETISESWIQFLLNTVEEDDSIGNVRSLRILLTLTKSEKFVLKRPHSARNMLFLLKQSLDRFKIKLETAKSSKRVQCLSDLYSLSASHLPIILDYATQDDVQLHLLLLQFIQNGNTNDAIKAAGILWNIAEGGDETVVQRLLDSDVHVIAFDVLKKYALETDKKKEIFSFLLTMLLQMARFSSSRREILQLDNIVEYMVMIVEKGYGVFGSDTLRAMMMLVFLLGTEEAESILRSGKFMVTTEHVQKLVAILKTTLHGDHGEDYRLGYFCIPLLVHACLALSQSDSNKVFLLQAQVVKPLTTILEMFDANHSGIPLCGGGGEDLESCTLAVEVLMHLSFHFQYSNFDLYEALVVNDDNTKLLHILDHLQSNMTLMMDTRSKAAVLLHRLHLGSARSNNNTTTANSNNNNNNDTATATSAANASSSSSPTQIVSHSLRLLSTEDSDAISISSAASCAAQVKSTSPIRDLTRSLSQSLGTPSPRTTTFHANQVNTSHPYLYSNFPSGKDNPTDALAASGELKTIPQKQHVMLSYSWHPSSKPQLVIQLQEELKRLGYDVWRDETGSLLVPPLAGCVMMEERLADAIETADTIIVCISPAYKLSSNCRLEASYAHILARRHQRPKILYLMMDEQYTTISKPHYCDGWLGTMIGTSVWYPLFDNELVTFTAASLIRHFSDSTHVILREQEPSERALERRRSLSSTISLEDSDTDDHMSALTDMTSSFHVSSALTPKSRIPMHGTPSSAGNGPMKSRSASSTAAMQQQQQQQQSVRSSTTGTTKMLTPSYLRRSNGGGSASAPSSSTAASHANKESKIPRGRPSNAPAASTMSTSQVKSTLSQRPTASFGASSTPQAQHEPLTTTATTTTTTTATATHHRAMVSPSSHPATPQPPSLPSHVPTTKEDIAWSLLNTSLMVKDEDALQEYLLQEGILQATDLRYCDPAMVDTIAGHLKTIPKRKFMEAVKAFVPSSLVNQPPLEASQLAVATTTTATATATSTTAPPSST